MTWEEFIRQKDADAFKRMFAEMILIVFNDILSCEYYQYHMVNFLQDGDMKSKKKIDAHNEAIDWLLSDEKMRILCFQFLGLSHLSKDDIMNAITMKFVQSKKFNKFFSSYADETDLKKEREAFRRTKKEFGHDS